MTRGSALVSVAALFLSGVAIGALGMFLFVGDRRGEHPRERSFGPPPRFAMQTMAEALDLTPEQREQIRVIHRESRRTAEEIRLEMRPRLEDQIERTRERMLAILTPEQRERFEEMRERYGGRMDRFFLGEGRGAGPARPRGPRRGSKAPPPPPRPDDG